MIMLYTQSATLQIMDDPIASSKKLLEEGQYEKALGMIEQALFQSPNNPEIWNQKGVILRSMGRYDEAVECFNKSLEIDPRDKRAS